jgi:decaprenylphospho-beta-D-ribofuranose 2-oxidase
VTLPGQPVELINWSKSSRSTCFVYPVKDVAGILETLATAQAQGLSVIPHGAGHSYTDAAINSSGIVIDTTPMHRILSWDPQQGIMRVEPGVTLQELIQVAWKDGWWPVVSPSTPRVTIGGCVAMNVNGKNAWKCGPFGGTVLSLDVLLATGESRTIMPGLEPKLFHAFVGSLGLLGFITSITLQLQRLPSGYVSVQRFSASSLDGIFDLFAQEEKSSDFMEAWLDGFASGDRLGSGHVTCATLSPAGQPVAAPFSTHAWLEQAKGSAIQLAAGLGRPLLVPSVKMANRLNYWWGQRARAGLGYTLPLVPYTFWPAVAFSGYHAMFPQGVETFQAFVPGQAAPFIIKEVLSYSQQQGCFPLWCVLKQHKRDPFLLSYQLDGYSLELNYARAGRSANQVQHVLQQMIATVIASGGRFYLAKDHFLTAGQYRQSVGQSGFETFLRLKQQFDPETRLQSDLFRRLFLPALL